MIAKLSRLVPAVLRHLDAYAEIAGADAREMAATLVGRLVAALMAAAAMVISLVLACIWLLMLTWDESFRAWVPAGLALFFALGATALVLYAQRHRTGKPFNHLRNEWREDRALFERTLAAWSEQARGAGAAQPEAQAPLRTARGVS